AADGQHQAAQSDLAGHGDLGAHRCVAEERSYGGEHRDTSGRSVFRHRAGRNMNVKIGVFEDSRVDVQLTRAAFDKAEGGLRALFHHVADLTRQKYPAFARVAQGFDMKDFSAGRRPGQPGNDSRSARLKLGFTDVLRRTENVLHEVRADVDVGGLAFGKTRGDGPANCADPAFEFAHARF